MSPRTSDSSNPSGGAYRKPRASVYTVMLLVALLCLIIGTVFLYLETQPYGPNPFSAVLPARGTADGTAVGYPLSPVGYASASLDCGYAEA